MHRFHVSSELTKGTEITLSREEARHALTVLRIHPGEPVEVLDGVGNIIDCELTGGRFKEARLRVLGRRIGDKDEISLTLIQAVVKGKAMDLILQKATEMGATRVIPLLAERTVAFVDEDRAESKVEKWRAISVEAMKQCGNPWLPIIDAPTPLRHFLATGEQFDLSLLAALGAEADHPRNVISSHIDTHGAKPRNVAVWIGPEGDFSAEEIRLICASGAKLISLGRLTLRSDTAAVCALAVLGYELRSR